jgi:hypothetical protein
MKLADLRKLSIRQHLKIHFQLPNGMECIVTEHGVAQVPGLRRAPDFNIDQELASIAQFVLEPATVDKKLPQGPKTVGRDEIAAMLAGSGSSASADHEEE